MAKRIAQIFLATFLLTLAATEAGAQIDASRGGAVGHGDFAMRYSLNSASPANLTWVRDPAGSTRTVLHARVRDTDAKIYGGWRTEISPLREYIRQGLRWYAISVYFPADWQFHAYPTIVAQIHTSQKKTILSPPLAFIVHGHNLDLELYGNHRPVDSGDVATRGNSARQLIRLDRVQTAHWYCFVVRADWSSMPGKGSVKIWMNGAPVYEGQNLYNAYETWLGNYPKAGIYMPGMMGVSERDLYFDFIHLGGARSSFDEMAAQTPCGTPNISGNQ